MSDESPREKRGDWAELMFAKTSGTVTRNKEKMANSWPVRPRFPFRFLRSEFVHVKTKAALLWALDGKQTRAHRSEVWYPLAQ